MYIIKVCFDDAQWLRPPRPRNAEPTADPPTYQPPTALASNNPKDKADWIEDKIDNEGYDDIYFADDSKKNVDATKKMLRGKDVRWRVQHIKH